MPTGSECARPQESSSAFTGKWVGGIETGDDWQFITVSFSGNEHVAGQVSVPLEGFTGKFSSVQIDGSRIRCELGEGAAKLLLTGTITHDEIEGVAEGPGRKGRFTLIRVAQVAPGTLAGYDGAYRFRDGRELVIDSFPDIPSTLLATDVRTGEVRALYELQKAGMSQEEIKEALGFQIKKNRFMRTGKNWDQYQDARQQANGKKWFRFPGTDTGGPVSRHDPSWTVMQRFYFYDPAPALRALKCPILVIFGELDTPLGVKANVATIKEALQAAGHRDYAVKVHTKGLHNLLELEGGTPRKFARLKRFVPRLFETMLD